MMTRRLGKKRFLTYTVACVAPFLPAAELAAQCFHGVLWGNPQPIKVVLNSGIADQLCGSSSCSSLTDIRRTVEAVLAEYYNLTAGRLRFSYEGTTELPPGTVIEDRIHIFANPCPGGVLGVAAWSTGTWGKIRLCQSNAGGNVNWNTFQPRPGEISFHGVLLHELGHVIGMDHIEVCATPGDPSPASIMRTFYPSESEHLKGPDIAFVNLNYGVRTSEGVPWWTPDAAAWNPGGGTLPGPVTATGRLAASNSRSSDNNVYVGWTFGNVFLTRYTPTSWETISLVFIDDPPRPIYHPGVASRGREVFVSWLGNRSRLTAQQDLLAAVFDEGALDWQPTVTLAAGPTQTTNAGVSATYDPASDAFIAVWRSSSGSQRNSITYQVVGMSPAPLVLADSSSGNDLKASDTPSIACGSTRVLGQDNCLLAWIDGDSWQRPVRWAQGRVGPSGQLIFGNIRTHPYVTVGSASVAYWDDGPFPWLIALNQGGTTTYTWRKGAQESDSFEGERSLPSSTKVTLPAAGSRTRDGSGRGYVFLLELIRERARTAARSSVE